MCFRRIAALFDPKPWWLAGGIPASACVAAYQPKGASSMEAAYINLANPGLYTLGKVSTPTWTTVDGFVIDAAKKYFTTNIVVLSTTWSMICRFSNALDGETNLMGFYRASNSFNLGPTHIENQYMSFASGTNDLNVSPSKTNGVMAIADRDAYFNGALVGTIPGTPTTPNTADTITLGAANGTTIYAYGRKNIQAAAVFNIMLTNYQIAELTRAMNAL